MIILKLRIATRKSRLALIQTEIVMKLIYEKYGIECERVERQTEGDRRLDVKLDLIGGKGLFINDIEKLLLDGRADVAIHSLKDVPFDISKEFEIIATPVREDVRDVFISKSDTSFFNLPVGAKIGTSSNRRISLINMLRPDIVTVPIRGNVQTRVDKMETIGIDGIVLAAAGIKRLGLDGIITDYFDPYEFIPAVGQGAIGIEILKKSSNIMMLKGLDNVDVRICVECERNFMRKVNGSCSDSLGAYASLSGETMNVTGFYKMGNKLIKKDISGSKQEYMELGRALAEKIINDSL